MWLLPLVARLEMLLPLAYVLAYVVWVPSVAALEVLVLGFGPWVCTCAFLLHGLFKLLDSALFD